MFDSSLVGPASVNGRRMADDHYDIPWEFKNRTLAAVVGQQLLNKKREVEVPKEAANEVQKDPQQQIVRKRLSLPHTMCNNALGKKLMGTGGGGGGLDKEQPQPHGANGKTAPGTVSANGQFHFIQQPTSTTQFNPPQMALPCPLSHSPGNASGAAVAQSPPPPPTHRHGPTRPSGERQKPHKSPRKAIALEQKRLPGQNGASTASAEANAQLRNYPMVAMPTNPTAKEVIEFCQRRQCPPALEELDNLVHEKMNRNDSEKLLHSLNFGVHLLRRRPDRNLALSLRAKEGVLHIKLEFHQSQWILGDGPRFSSVHCMLRAYRRTELPVRGAEQIRLGILLKPSDIAGGLKLL
uniref:SH2 domain-containing protein n=1 Tax=Globodera pallida TaxID=36090 RepID=A0A183BSE3_GLOPA